MNKATGQQQLPTLYQINAFLHRSEGEMKVFVSPCHHFAKFTRFVAQTYHRILQNLDLFAKIYLSDYWKYAQGSSALPKRGTTIGFGNDDRCGSENANEGGNLRVNAAEKATNLEFASKIASVVNLFKSDFPDAKADLKPWVNDPDTQDLVDPDSIDIGFNFPGRSRLFQSRCVLVQIRFHQDPAFRRAVGVEAAGFDHQGKQWWLSTIGDWTFEGETQPVPEVGEKLKQFCRQVLQIFNTSDPEPTD